MTYPKTIPSYGLYGDEAAPAWTNTFIFEWIPQRSAPYQWVIQPHRHDAFLQLLYVTSGHVEVRIDDVTTETEAPCLILIPAGHVHGFRFSTDVDGPVITATQKSLESLAAATMPELLKTIRRARCLPLREDNRFIDRLMPLFVAVKQESQSQGPAQVPAGMSLLLALVIQVYRIAGIHDRERQQVNSGLSSRKARQVERFKTLVDKSFRSEHSVNAYARQIGVTAGQLSRLCRDVLGMSGLDVINARILHEAQRELVYTSMSIKQLASELGFLDDAYFCRFFRKHAGVSPKSFRSQALLQMQMTAGAAT